MPELRASRAVAGQSSSTPQIDDLMLAMDVVDTLRHNQDLVTRELEEPRREAELIERLRHIYFGQGIIVPESILQEGVRALKQSRFQYTPPQAGWRTTLAHWWVGRHQIGKTAIAIISVITLAWLIYQFGIARPEQRRAEQQRIESTERLPRALEQANAEAASEARVQAARARADQLGNDGRSALRRGDATGAPAFVSQLETLRADLRRKYTLRIVSRLNEPSGIWRIPRHNPLGRNYYLIVERFAPDGRILSLPITSEEDGHTWGVRVSKEVFEQVRQDKIDNGIVENSRGGEKAPGRTRVDYLMPVLGGVIL